MEDRTHANVADLVEGQPVDAVYLVRMRSVRTARDGSLYVQMELSDATGVVRSIMWNVPSDVCESFEEGSFVHVRGVLESYQGRPQLKVGRLDVVDPSQVNFADFLPRTERDVDAMWARLMEIVASVNQFDLRRLLDALFEDEAFVERFVTASAASSMHHARLGGLLEHTLDVTELALLVCQRYDGLCRDLLVAGAIVHDIGKVDEIVCEAGFRYSTEGRLIGHVVGGASMVDKATSRLDDFPPELLLRLKHMILSHHGEYDFGSPKLPMTIEAVALHYVDNLDAKMDAFAGAVRDDKNGSGEWTGMVKMFDRMLYKGS